MIVQLRLKQDNGISLILDKACLPLARNQTLLSTKEGVPQNYYKLYLNDEIVLMLGLYNMKKKKNGNSGLALMLHEYLWRNERELCSYI